MRKETATRDGGEPLLKQPTLCPGYVNGCPLKLKLLKLKVVVDLRARKCISKRQHFCICMLWCNHFRERCFSSRGCSCTVPSLLCWILSQDTNPPASAGQMFPKNSVWKGVMSADLSHSALSVVLLWWSFEGVNVPVAMALLPWPGKSTNLCFFFLRSLVEKTDRAVHVP